MRHSRHLLLTLMTAAIGACGGAQDLGSNAKTSPDGGNSIDAPCGFGTVTGELVDLDSSTSAPSGVGNAIFTELGGVATDVTAADGRFDICIAPTTSYSFDVDLPAGRLDAFAYIEAAAQTGTRPISLRSMTTARVTSLYIAQGLQFDATKAHVLVQLTTDVNDLTLDHMHDAPQAADDSTGALSWSGGAAGRYLLFPNVSVGTATAQLSGDYSGGPHAIPLGAGKLTFVALDIVFL